MEESKKSKSRRIDLIAVAIVVAVAVVAGLIFLLINLLKCNCETDPAVVEGPKEVAELYDPCQDDDLEEKPLRCHVDTAYPLEFIARFRSRAEECWVVVDGFAYDVTQKEGGYEYTGSTSLDGLCGQDASERFRLDQIDPPSREFLKGAVSS